ncbi:hypothetical protein HY839_02740 [Candidatus Azambacteria bacterium]|nr:hypothetical protein [Candidatus Azambacteria bacterium]
MKSDTVFYSIFVVTVLAMRMEVFLFPQRKLIVSGAIIHHFWIGVLFIFFALLVPKRYTGLRIGIFSVGSGLAADELMYIVLGGRTVSEYWSLYSVSGAVVLTAIIFTIRKWLIRKII